MGENFPKEVNYYDKQFKVESAEDEKYLNTIVGFLNGEVKPADMREAILKKGGPEELEKIKKMFSSLDKKEEE